MNDVVLLANIMSGVGSFVLFAGYAVLTILSKHKLGFFLSGIGSFILIISFYILDSYAFVLLNVVWVLISINGYYCCMKDSDVDVDRKPEIIVFTFLILVLPGVIMLALGYHTIVSWFSISIMLMSYFSFASQKIFKIDYIIFTLIANLLCLIHLVEIQNYASLIQTLISIIISFNMIMKEKNLISLYS